MKKFSLLFILLIVIGLQSFSQSIYQIQGQTANSPYNNLIVTTTGIVTAKYTTGYFIQDGDGPWSGVFVYDNQHQPVVGDDITITGLVTEYYTMTEIKNVSSYTVNSQNNVVQIEELTIPVAKSEAYEGVFVQIRNAKCTNINAGFGEWKISVGNDTILVDDMGTPYTPTLNTVYNVAGPVNFSYNFKLEPRTLADIQINLPMFFAVEPVQSNLTQTGFTLSWQTNAAGSTQILYGLTPEFELGAITDLAPITDHSVTFSDLSAGNVYFMKPFSVAGTDTTPTHTMMFATVSASSGKMKVYFNHTVDVSVALSEPAVYVPVIRDTVVAYINKARKTIDVTMYEAQSSEIIFALNEADNRGVDVRYITDNENTYSVVENLNSTIPVLKGNADGIMHDKFIIIDRDSTANAWLITGSMNHTTGNLGKDHNNMICIQDQSLTRGFTIEFNEMWGSNTMTPNAANAKFGSQKTDNTPHLYKVNDVTIESYFSPSDKTNENIERVIGTANNEMEFAMMVFTENRLGTAVKVAHDRGADIRGIVDYVDYTGSEHSYLQDNGVDVIDYVNYDGSEWPNGATLHHKYATIDYESPDSDPLVITGSHNWSASANNINDENTLVIHSQLIANLYHQEFTQRYKDQHTPVALNDAKLITAGTSDTIDCLDNDFIPTMITANLEIVTQPSIGTVQIVNNKLVYTSPTVAHSTYDTIVYRIVNTANQVLTDSAKVVVNLFVTGIETISNSDLRIYPNPSKGNFNLEVLKNASQQFEIEIVTVSGERVFQQTYTANTQNIIPFQFNLDKGIYFFVYRSDKGTIVKKVSVQ